MSDEDAVAGPCLACLTDQNCRGPQWKVWKRFATVITMSSLQNKTLDNDRLTKHLTEPNHLAERFFSGTRIPGRRTSPGQTSSQSLEASRPPMGGARGVNSAKLFSPSPFCSSTVGSSRRWPVFHWGFEWSGEEGKHSTTPGRVTTLRLPRSL